MLKQLDEEEVRGEMQIKDPTIQHMNIGAMMFHSDNESRDLVQKIFIQGDGRYWSKIDNAEDKVASFIFHDAIKIKNIQPPDNIEIEHCEDVTQPQKKEKERAITIMKTFGYAYESQETDVRGGIADAFMRNHNEKAVVECCSVTVSKGIECLAASNTKLWIFAKNGGIYKLTRGKNWRKMYRFYQDYDKYLEQKANEALCKFVQRRL